MTETNTVKTGTTTLGLVTKDVTILAADRKASMGYLVASKDIKKILSLDKHIAITTAGSVGDAQVLVRHLQAEYRLYELQEDKKISVKAASTLLANILYGRKYYPFLVQLLIGGYDESGPHLYSLALDGSIIEEKEFFSTGSGSPMVFGVLEDRYNNNLTIEEAKKLAVQAVHAAIQRDIASGGNGIDLVVIDKKGVRFSTDEEVNALLKK